jgi:hypothetical protein
MAYSAATPEQKTRVHNFVTQLRAATITVWHSNTEMTTLVQNWNSDILAIMGSPDGAVVVDNTGLAGAVPLTDLQVTDLFGQLQTMQTNTMTAHNKDLFMLATGPNNAK